MGTEDFVLLEERDSLGSTNGNAECYSYEQ